MASSELPSREDFLANELRVVEKFGICLEHFDSNHVPVLFGTRDSCRHIFGKDCLQRWMLSGTENCNKCPICRHILFGRSEDTHLDGLQDTVSDYSTTIEDRTEYYHDYDGYEDSVERDPIEVRNDPWAEWRTPGDDFLPAAAESDEGDGSDMEVSTWLQDITNSGLAYEFVQHVKGQMTQGRFFADNQLLNLLGETCRFFNISDQLQFRRHKRSQVLATMHDLYAAEDITVPEMREYWVSRMATTLGWQLESS